LCAIQKCAAIAPQNILVSMFELKRNLRPKKWEGMADEQAKYKGGMAKIICGHLGVLPSGIFLY
jgi:hypothetical protein